MMRVWLLTPTTFMGLSGSKRQQRGRQWAREEDDKQQSGENPLHKDYGRPHTSRGREQLIQHRADLRLVQRKKIEEQESGRIFEES